jgi:hypothetical protein
MYMEMATEEDKKMAEAWKADADGILIFVRRYLLMLCTVSYPVDRFILCCRRVLDLGLDSGHPRESARHVQFLPLEHLQDYG